MMNKSLPTILLVTVFTLSIAVFVPANVSAASISPGTDKNNCFEGMRARDSKGNPIFSNDRIKEYGLRRVQIREDRLNKIEKVLVTTRENYNYYNNKLPSVQKAIDTLNAKKAESLTGIASDPNSSFTFANVPSRTLDMGHFESVYANARNVVNASKQELTSRPADNKNRGELMMAACSVIWDAQVFSVVLPTSKRSYVLSRADILNLMNSGLNVSRQNTIASVYTAKKASDPNFDKDSAISSSPGFIANPSAEQGALAEVVSQSGGDAVALNDRLNQIAETILAYNESGELSATLSDVLSTSVNKKR